MKLDNSRLIGLITTLKFVKPQNRKYLGSFSGSCGLVIFAMFVTGVAMTTGATVFTFNLADLEFASTCYLMIYISDDWWTALHIENILNAVCKFCHCSAQVLFLIRVAGSIIPDSICLIWLQLLCSGQRSILVVPHNQVAFELILKVRYKFSLDLLHRPLLDWFCHQSELKIISLLHFVLLLLKYAFGIVLVKPQSMINLI